MLAALAAVTDRLGLAGTINSTFNEPYEVARQFATPRPPVRPGGPPGTSSPPGTPSPARTSAAAASCRRTSATPGPSSSSTPPASSFDSWRGDEIVADQASGQFLAPTRASARFAHHDEHFDISGAFTVPRSPQGRPVIFQAGDSDEGREFAAATADAIFTGHATFDAGRAFYADVKGRLAAYGRRPDQLVVLPAATFVLGDTDAEAAELAHEVRRQQVSGQTAIRFVEQLWNRDLSDYDPDGPLPAFDPVVGENTIAQGRASVRRFRDPVATAREWRERAEAEHLSLRELVIEVTGRQSFIGSAATVAETIDDFVQADASDGFILVPHITPGGLDRFADKVVPLLQERGVFRAEYEGATLRDHLGLLLPPSKTRTTADSRAPRE